MTSGAQRHRYKGRPERPWIQVRLATLDGGFLDLQLLADTGSPCALIISDVSMALVKVSRAPSMSTNFGKLRGGLLQFAMPELGLSQLVHGYASDNVWAAAKASHPDFDGLAGLPLLRMAEFGGDANVFWLKTTSSQSP